MGTTTDAVDQRLTSRWVLAGGLNIHTRVALDDDGAGPEVVLVHGVGVSTANVAPAAAALAPHCRVHAPDLPGHGRSDTPDEVLDVPGLADALADWADACGLEQACFLGNSFGCQIVADLAVRRPDLVSCAVLQGPTVDPHARSLPVQFGRWLRNGLRERSTQHEVTFEDWRRIGYVRLMRTARHTMTDRIEDKLPHVEAPTLVVRGSRDPIVPQRWAEEATRLLPRGELVVIPGATHTITHNEPQRLADVVVPFVACAVGPR